MSDEMLRDLVVRMATDPEFAERVRSDPGGVAAEHGLTAEQVGALAQLGDGSGAGGPSMLDARLSKSSLFFGGGMHADPHGLLPAPFQPHGSDAHDPAGFLCDGCEPVPPEFGPSVHADPASLLCNGVPVADSHPAALLCDGFHPVGMGVHADPASFLCNGVPVADSHPAALLCNGIAGPEHAIVGPDHPAGVPSAAAPISLLTGKVVAPVDSHGAGIGATADTHAAGPGGGPVSHGIVGPDKAHGIVGPDHQLGIVGPDKPQIVGPDHVHGIVGPDLQHGIVGPDKPQVEVPANIDIQAAAPKIDPHVLLCGG